MATTLEDFANGDLNYVAKLNSNNATVAGAVDALESSKQSVAEKGQPNGYAGLDGDATVPTGQIPDTVQLKAEKGAVNGYPSLDSGGHVPLGQLPIAVQEVAGGAGIDLTGYQLKSAKDQPSGYAGLDAGGKVPAAEIPSLSATYVAVSTRGAANGVATLDSGGHIPDAQIPSGIARDSEVTSAVSGLQATSEKGAANGYAELDSGGRVPIGQLPADLSGAVDLSGYETSAHAASTYAPLTQPVQLPVFYPGRPAAAAVMLAYLPAVATTIDANLSGTRCKVGTNPTATATLSVQKNGVEVATIQIATNGAITLSTQAAISLSTGDELTIVAPGSQDATLADVRFTIHGTR